MEPVLSTNVRMPQPVSSFGQAVFGMPHAVWLLYTTNVRMPHAVSSFEQAVFGMPHAVSLSFARSSGHLLEHWPTHSNVDRFYIPGPISKILKILKILNLSMALMAK